MSARRQVRLDTKSFESSCKDRSVTLSVLCSICYGFFGRTTQLLITCPQNDTHILFF